MITLTRGYMQHADTSIE